MASHLADFWYWWTGVLNELFNRLAPHLAHRKSGFTLVVMAENATLFAEGASEKSPASKPFPLAELGSRLSDLRGNSAARAREGTIRFGAGQFVLRQLTPLALPASQLQSAAALDLSVSTPFKSDQVTALPVTGAVQASSYAIVKNSILAPVLSAFRENRATVSSIEFETADMNVRLAHSTLHLFADARTIRKDRFFLAVMAAMAIAISGTATHAFLRNSAAIEQLSSDVETLATGAKVARKALDQRAAALSELIALRKSIEDTEPVTVVWEELAKLLPDTAYLTDFSFKSGQVTIAGYAGAAAALVVVLEQSQRFAKVGFMAPVIKTPGMDGERFEISLAVGG